MAVAERPPAQRWFLLLWVLLALLAIGALWAINRLTAAPQGPTPRIWPDTPYSTDGLPRSYDMAMARAEIAVANASAAVARAPDQWLMHEILASEILAKAQLSGAYDDYAAAERALEDGFKVAVAGSGPHMVRASLEFTMHRLAGAERQLDAIDRYVVPPDRGERAEIAAMRGDIAFYRGQYSEALAHYDQADALLPNAASFRRAIHAARTGNPDRALAWFTQAENAYRSPSPQTRAYFALQRGIVELDRGRLDAAMAHFRTADRLFPGRWLFQEHIAEVLTRQGKTSEAETLYRAIVRRTGHPEFIDALAGIAAARGDAASAARLHAQSSALWARRLQQFPEATYGHAIDHCIAKRDWPCALNLAQKNHQARPFGEARIALARALLGSGRISEARAMIETVLASAWRTHDLHRAAAEIYAASGMVAKAQEQARLASAA
ncbi:tetratricopeptide repeat protein [Sandarakinorhabdus sp. AAP62]|uniref:tetratricopeptide repeat protein n=1 Tax=Sandarakinorhabdus sp. AAP62 TaxID=1248916 RepID=UPI0002E145FE|nr:tetratricopeptide repeat protein [Sandarakinorhabdus sp. AAP62]